MTEMLNTTINQHGFSIVPDAISLVEREKLLAALGAVDGAGRRGLLAVSEVAEYANSETVLALVRPYLSIAPVPVRAIYFNKSPQTNWLVTWHQDLTIAVNQQIDLARFGPWSVKDGITHVQPPVEYLEQMLAVRIHFDAADESNGALKVLPGTHHLGRLLPEQIQSLRSERDEVLCNVGAGDVLLMRPLLLHASGRSTSHIPRRVLHIEYAGCTLPDGLRWNPAA